MIAPAFWISLSDITTNNGTSRRIVSIMYCYLPKQQLVIIRKTQVWVGNNNQVIPKSVEWTVTPSNNLYNAWKRLCTRIAAGDGKNYWPIAIAPSEPLHILPLIARESVEVLAAIDNISYFNNITLPHFRDYLIMKKSTPEVNSAINAELQAAGDTPSGIIKY